MTGQAYDEGVSGRELVHRKCLKEPPVLIVDSAFARQGLRGEVGHEVERSVLGE